MAQIATVKLLQQRFFQPSIETLFAEENIFGGIKVNNWSERSFWEDVLVSQPPALSVHQPPDLTANLSVLPDPPIYVTPRIQ